MVMIVRFQDDFSLIALVWFCYFSLSKTQTAVSDKNKIDYTRSAGLWRSERGNLRFQFTTVTRSYWVGLSKWEFLLKVAKKSHFERSTLCHGLRYCTVPKISVQNYLLLNSIILNISN